MDKLLKLAITMGDPAGVGPELAVRALAHPDVLAVCQPVVVGDISVLRAVARGLQSPFPAVDVVSSAEWRRAGPDCLRPTVIDLAQIEADRVQPGVITALTGRASYAYVQFAIEAAMAGQVAGMVTCPIHKEAFHAAGSPFPGHTEMLAKLTGTERYCMMLTSDEITCSFVTSHVGLRDVPALLNGDRILEVIELTDQAMSRWHQRPSRLVVCGLNPHAGEHGLFGAGEEESIIAPAVAAARLQGIQVSGPVAPDTAFVPSQRRQTDAYVCMYHDQGLIPLKALAFDTAINVTLGLPILRSSVDHGTALDIAWQGQAEITSLLCAIRWAAKMAAGGMPDSIKNSTRRVDRR